MSQSTANMKRTCRICDLTNVYIDACRVRLHMTEEEWEPGGSCPFQKHGLGSVETVIPANTYQDE